MGTFYVQYSKKVNQIIIIFFQEKLIKQGKIDLFSLLITIRNTIKKQFGLITVRVVIILLVFLSIFMDSTLFSIIIGLIATIKNI